MPEQLTELKLVDEVEAEVGQSLLRAGQRSRRSRQVEARARSRVNIVIAEDFL